MANQRTGYGINIPLTKQTDPRNFPVYEFHEYPKMILQKVDADYVTGWRHRNQYLDERTGKVCYMGASPKLGTNREMIATIEDVDAGFALVVGEPIIVQNPQEEKDFLMHRGEAIPEARPRVASVPVETDEQADDDLAKANAEIARLKRELMARRPGPTVAKAAKRKPGRPRRVVEPELVDNLPD